MMIKYLAEKKYLKKLQKIKTGLDARPFNWKSQGKNMTSEFEYVEKPFMEQLKVNGWEIILSTN